MNERFAKARASLRVRLIALAVFALLPAAGLILLSARDQRQEATENVRKEVATLVRFGATQQERLVEDARRLLVILADEATETQLTSLSPSGCSSLLERLPDRNRFEANLGMVSPDGQVLCSAQPVESAAAVGESAWFQRAQAAGGFAVGDFEPKSLTLGPAISFALPVRSADGLSAVLFMTMEISEFGEVVEPLPETAAFMLFDRNGTVLVRVPDAGYWAGRSLPRSPVFQAAAAGVDQVTNLQGVDGDERLYAFTPLGDPGQTGLYASLGIPKESAFAAADSGLRRNLAALGIVAALAIGLAWLASDLLIVRPTRRLLATTQQISDGDLRARTRVGNQRGELNQLGRAIDGMARALERRESEQKRVERELRELGEALEDRVRERTEQLTVASQTLADEVEVRRRAEAALQIARTDLEHRVTERTQELGEANQALESVVAELQRSNQELEQFAYVASHDLQEPLRMVSNYTQMLARRYRGRLDEDADEFIEFAVEGARRMQDLINDLLLYSRVSSQGREFAAVDLERALADATSNLDRAIADAGAQLSHDPLPSVLGDHVQLVELLQNLIANAVKFHGDAAPWVHVGAARAGRRWRISVSDNGIGIAAEHQQRIFTIFQRLHSRDEYPGTGIGLSICKLIVERHGGRLSVESSVGEGSRFDFDLAPAEVVSEGAGGTTDLEEVRAR